MDLNNTDNKIDKADLVWDESTPRSKQFNDIYFSPKDGLAETQYVFIENNHLKERWGKLKHNENFTIAETGFGTGLNFLATCNLWNTFFQKGIENKALHFISFEKYPLTLSELEKAHDEFLMLSDISKQFRNNYPKLISGVHRIGLANNITLTLIFGDALYALKQISTKIDAWYFDGFSPSENPKLWSEQFFNASKHLNKKGTTFSTFTSAGHVKRKLEHIGFNIEKVKGFGQKREMLRGEIEQDIITNETTNDKSFPYLEKPWLIKNSPLTYSNTNKVVVIGSGLAGAWSAYKLAERGFKVTVIDAANKIASGASGNPRGATYFKLVPNRDVQGDFYLTSYLYSIYQLNSLLPDDESIWHPCGLMQMAFDDEQLHQITALQNIDEYKCLYEAVDKKRASEIANISLTYNALYFKDGGSSDPQALCKHLLSHKNINIQLNTEITKLYQSDDTKQWALFKNETNITQADIVILTNSYHANSFSQSKDIPLFKVRGQSTQLVSNIKSQKLRTVICSKGYLTPHHASKDTKNKIGKDNLLEHTIGSTFDPRNQSTETSHEDNQTNIEYLKQFTPDFYKLLSSASEGETPKVSRAKAGLRCQTPDNLPVLGQLVNNHQFQIDFHGISKGKLKQNYPAAQYYDGLYINSGHGSRGLISTPLCAEILVNEILNETPAGGLTIQQAISPTRFNVRSLKRKS